MVKDVVKFILLSRSVYSKVCGKGYSQLCSKVCGKGCSKLYSKVYGNGCSKGHCALLLSRCSTHELGGFWTNSSRAVTSGAFMAASLRTHSQKSHTVKCMVKGVVKEVVSRASMAAFLCTHSQKSSIHLLYMVNVLF